MPESLLTILKFFLLALVWLFFVRVSRTAWAEIRRARRPAAEDGEPKQRRRPADRKLDLRLRVIDPPAERGRVFDLADELTVGRAPGCGVSLHEDTYASKVHARLFREDGQLWIEDLGSTNGTFVNTERIAIPVPLRRGDRLQVGQTVLEVAK